VRRFPWWAYRVSGVEAVFIQTWFQNGTEKESHGMALGRLRDLDRLWITTRLEVRGCRARVSRTMQESATGKETAEQGNMDQTK
jgi:hypothetical protein